jgi:hypothetical protein
MSNTSNFDFCVQLSIDAVREIFHLAFKNESLAFPHNVGPFERDIGGLAMTVTVTILDDESRPADLAFADDRHIVFALPVDVAVLVDDAPDPALSRITLSATAKVPGRLTSWDAEDGRPVLGITFSGVTATDVTVEDLTGLPGIGPEQFAAAVHQRYDQIAHSYTAPAPGGTAHLLVYDGLRDPRLTPPAPGNPPIAVALEQHGGVEYLAVTVPVHVTVPTGIGTYVYVSFGRLRLRRPVTRTGTAISVAMATEPADPALATVVELDNAGPGREQVAAQLRRPAIAALAGFGTLTAPAFTTAAATALLESEVALYARPLRFPLWTPTSDEPGVVLTTPVGFLLPTTGTLAVLVTRRSGTEADDVAPDDFRATDAVALAVGREFVVHRATEVVQARFPGVNTDSGHELHVEAGDATLRTCHVEPASSGTHDQTRGHLWVTGTAEVHIDCWPDPDVSFSGPVFVDATPEVVDGACRLRLHPRAGEFDVGQSCCDVLLDILIPIVGWIVLAVVESLIDEIGGQLAEQTAEAETQLFEPLPTAVVGVAEVGCCLSDAVISDRGFVFPGALSIRRSGRSFQDLDHAGRLPRPDGP